MRIEVLYFDGCPNREAAVERVQEVLRDEGISAEVLEVGVREPSAARERGFLGSPTVRVNGLDVEPEARTAREYGMMCRTYSVDGRREGLPSREMLRRAVREAMPGEMTSTTATRSESSSGAGTVAASLAAIGSVLAAFSCCLPFVPFLMAAGLAGTSAFLSEVRPYLLAGSVFFIAFGFYQARRARRCHRRTSVVAKILLWISAGFVLISIFFPQIMANAIANLGAR